VISEIDVRKTCHCTMPFRVYFFAARQDGQNWIAQHKGTSLLSMDEAYALARRKNELQYTEVLK
jgi:hypothetical protein